VSGLAKDLQRYGDVHLRNRITDIAHDLSGMALPTRRNYLLDQGTGAAMAGFASTFARFAKDDAGFRHGIAALAQVLVSEHQRHPQAMRQFDVRQLSNLASAFSKLPGDSDCRQALQSIAGAVCARARELADPRAINGQTLANLANALSKLPDNDSCRQALLAIARSLPARTRELADSQVFQPQHLSNLANALSKLPDDGHCRDALTAIAHALPARTRELADPRAFNAQGLSNLANALSKLPDDEHCRHGLQAIARAVPGREHELADPRAFNAQNLSSLANALSKLPDNAYRRDALTAIARVVPARERELDHPRDFNAQDLSNLANGLSKLPDDHHVGPALRAIARALSVRARELADPRDFNAQSLSNLANALSKLPDDAHCRHALTAIARTVPARARELADPRTFLPQQLASLANALSKLPDDGHHQQALNAIARVVRARERELADPRHFGAHTLSNLANALSKLPDDEHCRHGLQAIARAVSARSRELAHSRTFDARNLSGLANALSRLPHDTHCQDALKAIARAVPARARELADPTGFDAQSLSILANAMSKAPDDEHGRSALSAVAQAVFARARSLADSRTFRPQHLSGLANAVSKPPLDTHRRDALTAIARSVLARTRELADSREFNAQGLSNLANAMSKLPHDEHCRDALTAVAQALNARAAELAHPRDFDAQSLSNLANALVKLPDNGPARHGLQAIAHAVPLRARELTDPRAFKPQNLSLLAHAMSKLPDDEHCRRALKAIARAVPTREQEFADPRHFIAQNLSLLANAMSKLPQDGDCRAALRSVAGAMHVRARELADPAAFDAQGLSSLANAMSKLPDDEHCRDALAAIARVLPARAPELAHPGDFNAQRFSKLANALSKLPDDVHCRHALQVLARAVPGRERELADLTAFDPQSLSSLANAMSKLPDDEHCRHALNAVAHVVPARAHLLADPMAVKPQELAILANALSKQPDDEHCKRALKAIARVVPARAGELADPRCFNALGLSLLANAMSKLPDDEHGRSALQAVAQAVNLREPELADPQKFSRQNLSNLANALVKQLDAPECDQALFAIVQHLGSGGRAFGEFGLIELTQLAHACSRYAASSSVAPEGHDLALLRMRELGRHFGDHPDIVGTADTMAAANLLRAFGTPPLRDELRRLAGPALRRLDDLHRTTQFKPDNLETMGSLCAGLQPLLRGPQAHGRQHRREALRLLDKARPVIERKIDLYLQSKAGAAAVPAQPGEAFATRCPSLSVFQVLGTYLAVRQLPQPRGAAADGSLDDWLKRMLERTQESTEADLSGASWNMIAQIEADNPLSALDEFMQAHLQRVTDARPSTPFDVQQVLLSMDHEPRPPPAGDGVMDIPVVNLGGRPQGRSVGDGAPRYCAFARLTQGRVPLVSVQLPGQLSSFLLGRTVRVQPPGDAAAPPVHYRMDLFGGSRMKAKKSHGEEAAAAGRHGELIALPLSETAPGSAFDALARKLFPYKESFYYFQRMMLASPPSLPGPQGATDHVLEGRFRLAVLPDEQPVGAQRPFKLVNARGQPIALRPFDGCGFVRQSVAQRMPSCRQVLQGQHGEQARVPAFGEREPANLPSMALQHYPRDERVVKEATASMREQLRQPDALSGAQAAYRSATTTRMRGRISVAVPSADDKLHLPALKSRDIGDAGLLVGRSPYDKPNLRPIEPARVGTQAKQDPTAEFLSTATAIQYGFVAQEAVPQQGGGDNDAPMFFAKGLMVVVPDALWPADFDDRDVVMSAEDIKTHSGWTASKDRVTTPTDVSSTGILMATELLAPGSLVALPPAEQGKLDGDFDGDPLTIVSDRPALFELVQRHDQQQHPPALKPPKTHTPAIDAQGRYQFGRAKEILATKEQVMETYSVLQRSYCAQPEAAKAWFAQRALFGSWEGTAAELQQQVQALLEPDAPDEQALRNAAAWARAQARSNDPHTGARHPVAKEIDGLIATQLEQWAQTSPPASAGAPLSAQAQRLFPRLAQEYAQAATPAERLAVLMDRYPTRVLPSRVGYVPDDPLQSANNLLSLGIKVGTDAYKADTAVSAFSRLSQRLKSLVDTIPDGVKSIPYSSALADKLKHGRFDYDEAQRSLQHNPTLAGAVMQAALEVIGKQRLDAVATPQQASAAP
jgi:muconolactone delta-isomerase